MLYSSYLKHFKSFDFFGGKSSDPRDLLGEARVDLSKLGNISNLENRRIVHSRNFMYKDKSLCVEKNDGIATRAKDGPLFNIVKPNCESYKRSIYFSEASDWNSLEPAVRNLENIFLFKRQHKYWLLNTYKA